MENIDGKNQKCGNGHELKERILKDVVEYTKLYHNRDNTKKVNYGGRVYDEKEIVAAVEASLEFWLTSGEYSNRFEREFSKWIGTRHCLLVNSGSSANLLAFMALTSYRLGDRRVKRGDEVITVAAGFPTTIAPIIQYGAIPVFVDIKIPEYNINIEELERAVSGKTKAIMIAHTLGNPFDLGAVKALCEKYNLWLIEDNCDALGSTYKFNGKDVCTGTIGDIGTSSFYPPHHMTMGEGGAVYTDSLELKRIMQSMRDWGRDCWCPSGKDNTCKNRFNQQFGELPFGYDHKYVYSHFGYNLKVTEVQAAIGCAQLEKIDDFILKRKRNWEYLKKGLEDLQDIFILPKAERDSKPSWFGFLITVKENIDFTRDEIVNYLECNNIQTRMLFAGNIIKHPCFDEMRKSGVGYRVVGDLRNTNYIMKNSFWIGVYPGMTKEKLDYMIEKIYSYVNQFK